MGRASVDETAGAASGRHLTPDTFDGTLSRTVLTSANWMNEYLDPPATAHEQAEMLTRAGFPLEASEPLSGSDVRQDYEMTSNRGDCVCHVGLAREIAAISGRRFRPPGPASAATGPPAAGVVSVTNHEPELCPLYTARVIRGARVRPSPDWLADRLRAIDQLPRNNIVDASNFVLFELGQPTHVFDLARLEGSQIIVRRAAPGEAFLPIGEGAAEVELSAADLVIADARQAVAIAGVKGGAPTAVSDTTTDLLIEAATFDPVAVRNTSRRLGIDSDSSYRFERGVHAGQVNAAADRLVELLLDLAGGELCDGVVSDGAPIPPPRRASMRIERCRAILGVPITDEQMMAWLEALEFAPTRDGGVIHCTVPVHRLDIDREIDLVEEVGRMMGHDSLPVTETIEVRVAAPQPTELARQAVNDGLVGMGFVETITHGLIEAQHAGPFLLPGSQVLGLEDEGGQTAGHAQAGTVLRPSVLPSLLRVLAHNHDNGVAHLRLFESAATFELHEGTNVEREMLALVTDVEPADEGLRGLRGVIERLLEMLLGPDVAITIEPDSTASWLSPGAVVTADGRRIGRLGMIAADTARMFHLDGEVAAAELEIKPLTGRYPPDTEARALPSFPAVERDVSAIVDEAIPWMRFQGVVVGLGLEHLEAVEFVSTFRGRPIAAGRKSVTLRVRFRAPDRTLVHESVDVQVNALVKALETELGAEIRR